ncbi:MAG: hypothetical protein AABY88_12470 [Pseudomonadota bacterium]
MSTNALLHDLLQILAPGERLCLLPISRILVEEPAWISEEVAIFPPDAIGAETLRPVAWPESDYQRTLGKQNGVVGLDGDDLHWSKSGATRIDLPDFFGSSLVAFPVVIDWDAFLEPSSHEAHLEMLGRAIDKAERVMDLIRFEHCNLWTPAKLPGRAGLLGDTSFCAGMFYAPEDHESYIIAGQILTHQVIIGVGLDMTGSIMVRSTGDGEVGAVARQALRMYSEALEASTETSRFVQMMALIEFLAAPEDYMRMKLVKRMIARQVARDRADYDAILQDFLCLTSESGAAQGANRGLRHNIVHVGKRLEDLADRGEREAIFRRLSRYAGATIQQLRDHSYDCEGWSVITDLRKAAVGRLGLANEDL